jgi:glycosyltransferase involved in cell wall biosynthesis
VTAKLIVVGDGPDAGSLRASAPPNVEFRGSLPPPQVLDVLRGARALLVPSLWYEAQPRVILEAYAAGVPVAASRIGGLPDLIASAESGLLVSPHEFGEWAAAAERLLDDEESIRLGEGAYRLWQERYSPERGLRELEDAYRDALSGG